MTPERHLAAILNAWDGTDGHYISSDLRDALDTAQRDFDGIEDDGIGELK